MADRVLCYSWNIVEDGEFQDFRLSIVTLGYTCELDMSTFFAVLVVLTVRGQRLRRFSESSDSDRPLCSFAEV